MLRYLRLVWFWFLDFIVPEKGAVSMRESWVFGGWGMPKDIDYDLVQDVGFTDYVLGIGGANANTKRDGLYASYDTFKVTECVRRLTSEWIGAHIMFFVYREKTHLGSLYEVAVSLAETCKPRSILLNIEGPGLRNAVRGSISVKEYTVRIKQMKEQIRRVSSNTLFGCVVISPYSSILYQMLPSWDYVILEGYSFWSRDGTREWSHTPMMYPGNFQQSIVKKWNSMDVQNKPELIMGLAAYDLTIPKQGELPAIKTEKENVSRCIKAVDEAGIERIAVWSLKHFRGISKRAIVTRDVFKEVNDKIRGR